MSDFNNGYARPLPQTADMSVDAGLRSFMLGVYNKLALGLVVAGALAYVTGNVPAVQQLLFAQTADGRIGLTMLGMIVQFSPLVMLFGSMFFMKNPTAKGVNMLYWAVVATIGAGMGILFLRYTGGSLASTFLVTAAAFGSDNPPDADRIVLLAPGVWGWSTQGPLNSTALNIAARALGDVALEPPEFITRDIHASSNTLELIRNGRDPMSILATRFDTVYGLVDLMEASSRSLGRIRGDAILMLSLIHISEPTRPY